MIYDNKILSAIHEFGKINTSTILYVLKGIKPMARISVAKYRLPKLFDLCDHLNLKLIVGFNDITSSYNNINYKEWCTYDSRRVNDEDANLFIYVGKDIRKLQQLRYYDEDCDHLKVGKLLGYPRCCIKNYKANISDKQDYYLKFHSSLLGITHLMNFTTFCFDASYFEHIPCSLDCKGSKEISERNSLFLSSEYDTLSYCFESITKSFVVYTERHGIFIYKNADFQSAKTVTTSKALRFSSTSEAANFFISGCKMVMENDGILIDDIVFIKDNYRCFNFI